MLSVLVPAYNKGEKLRSTMETIAEAREILSYELEVVIIDDASTDETPAICRELKEKYEFVRVITHSHNQGFSKSYQWGVREALGSWCVYVPADDDIASEEMLKVFECLDGTNCVLTYFNNSHQRLWWRRATSRLYTLTLNLITGRTVPYYNGFNIYLTDRLRSIHLEASSFAFQAELLLKMLETYPHWRIVDVSCRFDDLGSSALKWRNIKGVLGFVLSLTQKRGRLL